MFFKVSEVVRSLEFFRGLFGFGTLSLPLRAFCAMESTLGSANQKQLSSFIDGENVGHFPALPSGRWG